MIHVVSIDSRCVLLRDGVSYNGLVQALERAFLPQTPEIGFASAGSWEGRIQRALMIGAQDAEFTVLATEP